MAEATQEEVNHDTTSGMNHTDHNHDNPKHEVNGYDAHNHSMSRTASDPDAQEMLISSLRSQIQDLFSQVTGLNNKLVTSYDRVSDLEDSLHIASANVRSSNIKISQLELERTEHLSALNTGLLVEKSHVTSELSRLMEKATEEAAQRGQAESARAAIEQDLDDLSATLFGQANSMVAEARYAQHLSERKAEASERGFKGAEEAVKMMQQQMQALQADKEEAERKLGEMQVVMGKGKSVERRNSSGTVTIRLMSSHTPYQEFLLFVAHLRTVHASTPQPPTMTSLLTTPFIARLLNEDSDPTVRLDFAPSLNWLTRRSVLSAIHNGQLTVEPVSSSTLLQESFATQTSIPGLNSGNNSLPCALCGTPIFSLLETNQSRPQSGTNSAMASWSTALFKIPATSSWNNSRPPSPTRSISRAPSLPTPPQVHIFRLAPQTTNSTLPYNHDSSAYSGSPQSQSSTMYPLCTNGWCLTRLRSTCTLWAFVRTGIVEKVWEEELPNFVPPSTITPVAADAEKPPVPPRRRGLWKMASALGERAASWSGNDSDGGKKPAHSASPSPVSTPPPPPPRASGEKRRLPPPPTHPVLASHTPAPSLPVRHAVPPPLPKRSEVRRHPSPPTASSTSASTSTAPPPPYTSTPPPPETTSKAGNTSSDTSTVTAPNTPMPSPPPPQPPQRSPYRSVTPVNIPLPESRPHTPPVIAASTAPMSTPPPLPRRAAGRGSRLIPDGMRPGASAAASPVLTKEGQDKAENVKRDEKSSVEKNEESTKVVAEEGKEKESGVGDIAGVESPAEIEEKQKVEEVKAEEVKAEEEAKVEETMRVEEEVKESMEQEQEQEQEPAATSSTPVDSTIEPKKNYTIDGEEEIADAEKAADGNDKDWEEVQAEDVNGEKDVISEEDKDAKLRELKNMTSEATNEAFIGDATWEERTWKELVRLREEMFWARVGALRR